MKLIYIVIICAIGSCRKVNDNIYGHWHVFDNKFGYGDYITLDVYDSINPILGKYSIFPSVSGDFDEGKRELNFTGECGIFRFQYKWIKDTLYLQNHLADRFAINYSKSNCSPTIDIKNSFRVNVDFPTAQKCNVNRFFDENVEFQNIFIGEPTKEYSYYPGIRIVIGGKFSHIAEIPLWIAEIRKSYSKDRFKSLPFRLISDSKVSIDEVNSVTKILSSIGIENVYIMMRDTSSYKYLFSYYKINEDVFDSESSVLKDMLDCK